MFCNTPVICYFKASAGNFAYCDGCVIAAVAARGARTLLASISGPVSLLWVPPGLFPWRGCLAWGEMARWVLPGYGRVLQTCCGNGLCN